MYNLQSPLLCQWALAYLMLRGPALVLELSRWLLLWSPLLLILEFLQLQLLQVLRS